MVEPVVESPSELGLDTTTSEAGLVLANDDSMGDRSMADYVSWLIVLLVGEWVSG